ncbi:MAG: lytic transglycosylase domain-containing protein [Terriglobales bacterium]
MAAAALPASAAEIATLRNGFEIRHHRREQNGTKTRLYLDESEESGYVDVRSEDITEFRVDDTPQPQSARSEASAAPAPEMVSIPDAVNAASDRHRVDPDLIASVIDAESGGKVRAVSRKGAQGLMQLMPATAARLGVSDAFEPQANIDGGTRYLRELLVLYKGDVAKALAAYNAGPGSVERHRGVPPYRETYDYVTRVIRDFNRKKLAQEKQAKKPSRKPVLAATGQ